MAEKSERFGLVLTPLEKQVLTRLAEGESQASLLRRLIRREAQAKGLWPKQRLVDTRASYEVSNVR